MIDFLDNVKSVLRQFVEIGFLAVLAVILISLLLGQNAGGFVNGVAENVTKFAAGVTAPGMIGIAIILVMVYLIMPRLRRD